MVNSAMCSATRWAVLPSAKHTQEHHRLPLQVLKKNPPGLIFHQGLISCQNQCSCSLPIPHTHTGASTWSTWTCPASTNIQLLLTTMTSFTALRFGPWFECWWWTRPFVAPRWRSTTSTWSRTPWGSCQVLSTSTSAPSSTTASSGLSAKLAQGIGGNQSVKT